MDQGRITTYGPQEDEFALLLLGDESAYRGFIDPRRLGACCDAIGSAGEGALRRWQDFLRGIVLNDTSRRLLIKSPSHTFRLPLLRTLFPKAKYIWMGRHTEHVLASNLRMWTAMMDRYGLWKCPSGLLNGFLRDVLRECAGVLARCLEEMSPESMFWIDFEDLQVSPKCTLERVIRFLGPDSSIDEVSLARRLDQALERVPIYEGARVSVPADENIRTLERLMAAARQRFGSLV